MAPPDIRTSARADIGCDALLDSSVWWAALPLDQRRRLPGPRDGAGRDRGARRLAGWRTGRVTGGLELDLSRWHAAGIGADELELLLGESEDELRARLPHRPPWLTSLARAWSIDPAERPEPDDLSEELGPAAGLLALVHPLTWWHQGALRDEVNRLAREHGVEPVARTHPLLQPNYGTLLSMITPVLAVHLQRARAAGTLAGDTPPDRFADFVRQLREPEYALRILAQHPTLARELVDELETWVTVRRELAERLLADLPALRTTFGVTCRSLHDLTEVRMGAGDTHRGGRSVAVLTFADGGRVVYKPRRLSVEAHFYTLVEWLNARGLTHPLRRLAILDRPDYGWVEFASAAGCADEDGLRRFFWRQGAYLSLLYVLRAADIHLENLIAAGDQPIIVDLEATFQQPHPTVGSRPTAAPDEAQRLLDESVLSVGLLPQRLLRREGDDTLGVELSGLAGGAGELTPMRVPHWQDIGTDRMRRIRGRVPMPGAQNLPTLNGAAVDPTRYRAELVAGFEACYRILLAHRAELTAADGPIAAFATDEIRVIVLGTAVYGRILGESWHPAVLGDALDRECLFEVLSTRHPDLRANHAVAASEIRQIGRRDVPFFWTRPDSRHLYDDRGVVVRDFFPRSGLELVYERIAGLSTADLRRQSWSVSASLTALQIGDQQRDKQARSRELPTQEIDQNLAERAAIRIGDQLLATAVGDPRRPVWLTLTLVADRYWSVIPTAFEPFGGLCGIALFLGQLGARTGLARFRAAAEAIVEMLSEHVDALLGWPEADRNGLGIGGFSELGGYVHTLAHLGALWRAQPLLDQARRLVPELTRRFADDRARDVLLGTAGAALALRALHSVHPDEQVRWALRAAGDQLLRTATSYDAGLAWETMIKARSPLLGFSHGVAGIGYALAEIGTVTGEERFLDAAARAVRYEHAQYDPVAGDWPDHRTISPEGSFMNAWCHGAAGIGLARAELLGSVDIPETRVDLDAAVAAVRRDLVHEGTLTGIGNDCLCHGDLGLAETLLTAGRVTGDDELVGLARRAARAVAESVLASEERCGVPLGLHVPGLLMGAAGIGYGLLRMAQPDRTPNVLLLAAPTTVPAPVAAGPPNVPPPSTPERVDAEEAACPAYQ